MHDTKVKTEDNFGYSLFMYLLTIEYSLSQKEWCCPEAVFITLSHTVQSERESEREREREKERERREGLGEEREIVHRSPNY